jgi:hypothetical protein
MLDYKQKNKLKNILYSPLVVCLLACLALYCIYSTWTIYSKLEKSRQDLVLAQKQLLTLDAQNTGLDQQISSLQTTAGKEDEIRTKYGEAKAGESMAVIVESDATSSLGTSTESFWVKVEHFFGF